MRHVDGVVTFGVALLCVALALAGVPLAAQEAGARRAVPRDPVDSILDAFKAHQVVTMPGGHAGTELHALLLKIIRDPRVPGTMNDLVVEFGRRAIKT